MLSLDSLGSLDLLDSSELLGKGKGEIGERVGEIGCEKEKRREGAEIKSPNSSSSSSTSSTSCPLRGDVVDGKADMECDERVIEVLVFASSLHILRSVNGGGEVYISCFTELLSTRKVDVVSLLLHAFCAVSASAQGEMSDQVEDVGGSWDMLFE